MVEGPEELVDELEARLTRSTLPYFSKAQAGRIIRLALIFTLIK